MSIDVGMNIDMSPDDRCAACHEPIGNVEREVVVVAGKDLSNRVVFDGAELYRVAFYHVEHAPPEPVPTSPEYFYDDEFPRQREGHVRRHSDVP